MQSPGHLEAIAQDILNETGLGAPMDAFELAECCGLTVKFSSSRKGNLADGVIRCPAGTSNVHQHGTVAHEVGHWALVRAGLDGQDEDDARYMAGALMIPRPALLDDLRTRTWDLLEIHPRHPNASWEMLVIRCVQVADAYASIWDQGRCSKSYGVSDEMLAEHKRTVMRVLETGHAERGAIDAYPVFTKGYRRVVCLERTS